MIILEKMELKNFRNLKGINSFEGLKDLNIFIGPNNCGKSNILRAIIILNKVKSDREIQSSCKECRYISDILRKEIKEKDFRYYQTVSYAPETNDEYLNNGGFKISFFFNESFLSEIVKHISGEKNKNLKDVTDKIKKIIESQGGPPPSPGEETIQEHWHNKVLPDFLVLTLKKTYSYGHALNPHISLFSLPKIIEIIKKKIVSIPELRLGGYKEKSIYSYIYESGSNPRKDEEIKLIATLSEVVDPSISTSSLNVSNKEYFLVDEENFECSIVEQGSGVRAVSCFSWDIIRAKNESIITIDEPELGLNPAAKQELLRLLIKKSEKNQIFIATQDPTFLNPNLWKNENVSVFLYSIPKKKFIKVNLEQNCGDPETFGGYLPHTTSMKNIHLYVEGPSDVYTIQNFLVGWLQREFSGKWHEKFNKIGIFNLGGDCWEHFLYTIPNKPYKSVVLLDKDKVDNAKEICSKYNEERKSSTAFPIFHFCDDLSDVDKIFNKEEECPIYCLKKGEIEDYLDPKPSSKRKDPEIAYKMVKKDKIPTEFEKIFQMLTKNL